MPYRETLDSNPTKSFHYFEFYMNENINKASVETHFFPEYLSKDFLVKFAKMKKVKER